jgi:hypothetical protein
MIRSAGNDNMRVAGHEGQIARLEQNGVYCRHISSSSQEQA